MGNIASNKILILAIFSVAILSACGKSAFMNAPSENKPDLQTPASPKSPDIFDTNDDDPRTSNPTPDVPTTVTTTTTITNTVTTTTLQHIAQNIQVTIESETRVRTLKNQVLESVYTLAAGDIVEIDKNTSPISSNYRNENGEVKFSSTGFYSGIKILKTSLSEQDLKTLNATESGLFITSIVISSETSSAEPNYRPLTTKPEGKGYLAFFQAKGQPRPEMNYIKKTKERFPQLNVGVSWASMKPEEQKKWSAIMAELQKVADRTRATPRDLLIIDVKLAQAQSLEFETNEVVHGKGAWSIALKGTAKRNGFEDVPCAEFMSEVIRQAYFRAGYKHQDDFNAEKKNILNYQHGASAVFFLSQYLAKAGWIPWHAQKYAPPIGAVIMHNYGFSPGHTYMSAGSNGRFIIDNGSPQGRDLRAASQENIAEMYQTGVFFLPPGFTPLTWEDAPDY